MLTPAQLLCHSSGSAMPIKSLWVKMMRLMPCGATSRIRSTRHCEKKGTSIRVAAPPCRTRKPHGSASSGFSPAIKQARFPETCDVSTFLVSLPWGT